MYGLIAACITCRVIARVRPLARIEKLDCVACLSDNTLEVACQVRCDGIHLLSMPLYFCGPICTTCKEPKSEGHGC
jgi:hypothetical protein